MILSDRTIKEHLAAGSIIVEPLADKAIQPSSVDVRISSLYRTFRNHTQRVIDVKEDQAGLTELVDVGPTEPFILHPGEFVLGSTYEVVTLPEIGRAHV